LASGVELQRTGRHAEAEKNYRRLLPQWPANPDLPQLLGVALKAQGKLVEAEERLRQSLAIKGAQPHVWSNLGNLLSDLGRFAEAANAFDNAIEYDARCVDALIGRGGALMSLGRLSEAEASYRRAKEIQPRNASAAIGLATIATKRHDDALAETLLRDVLAMEPQNATALRNLGMIHAVKGDGETAQPLIERAVALRPHRADMLTSLGYALQIDGRNSDAIARYRQAIARDPTYIAAYEDLARLLWQAGDRKTYLTDINAAIARFPQSAPLRLSRAGILALAKQYTEAEEEYARAERLQPGNPIALDGRARIAAELGDAQGALAFHARALETGAKHAWVALSRAHSLLRLARYTEAIAALDGVLAIDPFDQLALGDLALALRATGDPREHWLADYERLARTFEVPPPRGYSDMAKFNADLDHALDELHSLEVEPIDQTLRKGTQTPGSLFGRKSDLIARLRERLDEVVQTYIENLPDDAIHPFLRRKSGKFRYTGSWSARLKSSGYHVTHIHPQGWISSAYYVALPPSVDDVASKEGWFTLGDPPFDVSWNERVRRYIQPREGMLVLFPSYFYHGTVPFAGSRARTTVAFDAVPRE
jgi:tetratricopeptide (TPR) repeat protein